MLLPATKVTLAVPFTTKPLFTVMLVPAWKQKLPKLIVVADGLKLAPSFVQPATEMGALVPVIAELSESVAVMVCEPAVANLAEKTPTPLVRVMLPGRKAEASVLVKATGSVNVVKVLLYRSSAVTVN